MALRALLQEIGEAALYRMMAADTAVFETLPLVLANKEPLPTHISDLLVQNDRGSQLSATRPMTDDRHRVGTRVVDPTAELLWPPQTYRGKRPYAVIVPLRTRNFGHPRRMRPL